MSAAPTTGRAPAACIALALGSFVLSSGCSIREIAPPKAPDKEVPSVPDMPAEAEAGSTGRLILDSNGEAARISRVVERVEPPLFPVSKRRRGSAAAETAPPPHLEGLTMQPLCYTPCAVNLPRGAHTLVFTSTTDDNRTSSEDIAVPRGTTVVRHAIGHRATWGSGTAPGLLLAFGGGGLTLLGMVGTSVGLVARPEHDDQGAVINDRSFELTAGLVLLGVGIAAGVTGTLLLMHNRPQHQPGATTQFQLP